MAAGAVRGVKWSCFRKTPTATGALRLRRLVDQESSALKSRKHGVLDFLGKKRNPVS
jgi:hypothetical protein